MNTVSRLTRWALPAALHMLDGDRGTHVSKISRDAGRASVRLDDCMAREAGPGQPIVTEGCGRRRRESAWGRTHDNKRLRISRCDVVDYDLERHSLALHLAGHHRRYRAVGRSTE